MKTKNSSLDSPDSKRPRLSKEEEEEEDESEEEFMEEAEDRFGQFEGL